MALTDKLTAIADAIRGKTGKTDGLTLDQMATEIAGIEAGGGGGGIGAVKFVDEDITIAESTTTAVTYTIDGVAIPTLATNPTKWATYSGREAYVCFITPKEVAGEYVKADKAVSSAMFLLFGHTNYGQTLVKGVSQYGGGGSSLKNSGYGFFADIGQTSNVINGVPQTSVNVKAQTASNGYFVPAGVYNVQFWMLTDFSWVV